MQAATRPSQLSLFVTQEAVSKSALLAFRTISRLAQRTGVGCVNLFSTLAGMLGVSVRRAWQLIAELRAAGWIFWTPIRTKGKRYLEFGPLVKLPKQSRGRFAPRQAASPQQNLPVVQPAFSGSGGSSFCPKSALSNALSNAKKCTLDRGTPYKTSPVGTEDDNRTSAKTETLTESKTDPVAVSLLENVVSSHEAQELAREATKKALTPAQIERVIAAYRGQQEKIRNRGAWLREAIRREFTPAAAPATHQSEVSSAPTHKVVRVKAESLPTVQPPRELLEARRDPGLAKILAITKKYQSKGAE